MPSTIIRDAFVRDLSWDKASREWMRKRAQAPIASNRVVRAPVQISYFERMERGLSLVLTVGTSGLKTFSVMTYRAGKPRVRKLGAYPGMTVKSARAKARVYWADPLKFEEQAAVGTFRQIADSWLVRHVQARGLRSELEIRRQLSKYIYPRIGSHKMLDVRRSLIADLLDDVAIKHGAAQADACLAVIRGIMNWYQSRNEHYTSPIVPGMKRDSAKPRNRILNDDEIRAMWENADGTFGALCKLGLLTAQRKQKLCTIKWADLVDGEWRIATLPREKGNPGLLRLPQMAIEILAEMPRIKDNEYVFVGRGNSPFSRWSEMKAVLDKKLHLVLPNMARWTIHDLRRTARSLMSRAGVLPHIAEQVLGHAQPGIVAVYDRHNYDLEKAEALNKLASVISRILDPGSNVVALVR